jgi:hypothetical protein
MTQQPFELPQQATHMQRKTSLREAQAMLDAFADVGVRKFSITFTDRFKNGRGGGFKRDYVDESRYLRNTIDLAIIQKVNAILRPLEPPIPLIQLDDLGMARLATLRETAFLGVCTSPDNFQAWVAVEDADDDFARRLKIGCGADLGANGAVRLSGTRNVKEEYAEPFPFVRNVFVAPGRIVKRAVLEALGVVAPPSPPQSNQTAPPCACSATSATRRFPDYLECLSKARKKRDGKPDRSAADWSFCCQAAKRGFSAEEIASVLTQVSDKALQRHDDYALRTAHKAVEREASTGGGL